MAAKDTGPAKEDGAADMAAPPGASEAGFC